MTQTLKAQRTVHIPSSSPSTLKIFAPSMHVEPGQHPDGGRRQFSNYPPRAGAPSTINPTRLFGTPPLICGKIFSAPRNPPSVRRLCPAPNISSNQISQPSPSFPSRNVPTNSPGQPSFHRRCSIIHVMSIQTQPSFQSQTITSTQSC